MPGGEPGDSNETVTRQKSSFATLFSGWECNQYSEFCIAGMINHRSGSDPSVKLIEQRLIPATLLTFPVLWGILEIGDSPEIKAAQYSWGQHEMGDSSRTGYFLFFCSLSLTMPHRPKNSVCFFWLARRGSMVRRRFGDKGSSYKEERASPSQCNQLSHSGPNWDSNCLRSR